jgi:hypothetical protein
MPKPISAANAVMHAVEYAAGLYGVRSYRMQSRMVRVIGAGGRERPMFMGQWKDEFGGTHYKGIADILLTPRLLFKKPETSVDATLHADRYIAVALWVECKSGKARLSDEQKDFRDDVQHGGAFWLEARDCADAVIDWFTKNGVERR